MNSAVLDEALMWLIVMFLLHFSLPPNIMMLVIDILSYAT